MLQQTQTARVEGYFEPFTARFPDYASLAAASLAEVIESWQGLGYNRRARFLHQAAQRVMAEHGGALPADEASLRRLPGIGSNTAASIMAFAFNLPTVFIETNIRTVYLGHYFPDRGASDQELLPLVARTVDRLKPREWYWALMDYGVHLKKTVGNASRRSPQHTVQSRFEGSIRQLRGGVLRQLLVKAPQSRDELYAGLQAEFAAQGTIPEARLSRAVEGLLRDGLVSERVGFYGLPAHPG